MNAEQRTEYWHRFHRFQKRYEAIYTPKFNAALKEQIKQYTESGTIIAVDSSPIYPVLIHLYTNVGMQWAHKSQVLQRTLKSRQPMGFSERLIALMKAYYGIDLLNDAEGITETTREQIQRVLSEGAQAGWSFDEMVRKLESPEMTRTRSRLISRTETVAAANGASLLNAKETPGNKNKIWISARDHRTRMHHREVDNHIVGIDEDFNVGGTPMKAPGDKRGGAAECCNCRCAVAFIPLD